MSGKILLPGYRRREWAKRLLSFRPPIQVSESSHDKIKIVCISDTHNHKPDLPPGDLLLHAGDLTEWGSFEEIQAQLDWLSSQPHTYKVIIAGNHDVLLDANFMAQTENASRVPWSIKKGKEVSNLNFGTCTYLVNEETIVQFKSGRRLKIFGCPTTPAAGHSAFQVPRNRCDEVWAEKIPNDADIVLTHGPPYGKLDRFPPAGCIELLHEIMRVRPRLMVFGHIHVGHGREEIVFDTFRNAYERLMYARAGYKAIFIMACMLIWLKICDIVSTIIGPHYRRREKITTLVNAALVGGPQNELVQEAFVVEI